MSDRPQGSVRTGSRGGDGPAGGGAPGKGGKAQPSEQEGTTGQQAAGQPAPGTGTQSIPTTGTQSIPVTGAQAVAQTPAGPATGKQSVPTTGTQSIPVTGAQAAAHSPAAPATGTQSVPVTGSQRATGATPPAAPPAAVPPVPVPPSGGGAPAGARASAGAAKGRPGRSSGRGPRRARLQLRHIDTWSALKISLVLSIALFFIWMVAVGVLYLVLNALGVFDTLNELFGQLGTESGAGEGSEVLTPGVVFGGAAIIGAINIVLLTALCTVGAFIYNMCSDLVGGLEVTLSERD